jgi:hypothetical protein
VENGPHGHGERQGVDQQFAHLGMTALGIAKLPLWTAILDHRGIGRPGWRLRSTG